MPNDASLASSVAVVTGAGRGIGKAAAQALAARGAAVVACARLEEEVARTAREIEEQGGRAAAATADVSRWEDMERLAERTRQTFGPADLVVANAAVVEPLGFVEEVDPEVWAGNVAINLTGAFHAARAFLPQLRERGRGALIFIGSGVAGDPIAGFSAYGASKAGLEHLVRTLALEVEQRGLPIRVYGVLPGIVDTSMQAGVRAHDPARLPEAARFREFHRRGWLRRPEEPARLIGWLAAARPADLHGAMASVNDAAIQQRVGRGRGRWLARLGRG